jgi:pimeloyl-ACP methyl ester carboxylesterase
MTTPSHKAAARSTRAIEDEALQCLRLPSGVELHHVQGGRGEPLVFVHGVMGDWATWAPQWPAFTPRFACNSYSRRYNHPNRNAMPSPDHSALVEAEDLRQLLDALGLHRVGLVASSYGAFVALALAVAHPQRVRSPRRHRAGDAVLRRLQRRGPRGAVRPSERDVVEPQPTPPSAAATTPWAPTLMTGGISAVPLRRRGQALQRRLRSARAMRMLALSSNEFPLLPPAALAALPMPVLLVSGADTPAIHRETFRNLAAAMPQAARMVVPGAGHAVARDQPQAFNDAALRFLHDPAGWSC